MTPEKAQGWTAWYGGERLYFRSLLQAVAFHNNNHPLEALEQGAVPGSAPALVRAALEPLARAGREFGTGTDQGDYPDHTRLDPRVMSSVVTAGDARHAATVLGRMIDGAGI